MTGSGRPSRRGFLHVVGRLAGGGAVASSLLVAKAGPARAIGDRSLFRFARLAIPGLPDPRPTALRRLAWEVVRRTSVATASDPIEIRLADPNLFRYPFLVLSGDRRFALPPEADIARLRRHITYGGFLLIDSAEGRAGGGFDESVRRLLAQTLPGELPIRIPDDHVLWKSFYVLRSAPGRIVAAPHARGRRARPAAGGGLHAERSRRRARARRLRTLGARGHPGRRRPARGGVPAGRSTW